MPRVVHPCRDAARTREDGFNLELRETGGIFFGNEQITAEELPAKIEERLSHGAERKVYIKADARARYGAVRIVSRGGAFCGVENVGILVEQR